MSRRLVSRSTRRLARPLIEQLESRKLLHATIDLRVAGGGQSVTVDSVGQVINLEVWGTVTGHNGNPNDEGIQIMSGSFLSTDLSGGAAGGNFSFTLASPFDGSSSSAGSAADLDSDGDLDIGSNGTAATGMFGPRSNSITITGGTTDGDAHSWLLATGTFTVTDLREGANTTLTFRPRSPVSGLVYAEDAQTFGPSNGGSLAAGDVVTLSREGTASISGRVFDDKNATGFFDGDDEGVSGFRVFLDKDFDGVLDGDEVSKPVSSTGTYTFSDLDAGTYRVTQVPRADWRTSFPGEGYYELTLGFGDVGKSLSFANTQGVLIKGFVWHDSNADRVKDSIEDGLARWRVIVDLNNNGLWDEGDISKETNESGGYRLSLLTNGTFSVMVKQVEGYRQTTNGGFPREITLGPGATTSNKNFGFKRLKLN